MIDFNREVTVSGQDYVLTLKRPESSGLKDGKISGQINYEVLSDRQIEILNYIIENYRITRKELTYKIGINPSAIRRYLEKVERIRNFRKSWN